MAEDKRLVINNRSFSDYAKSVLLETIEKQMVNDIKDIATFDENSMFFENIESLVTKLSELAVMHRTIDGSYDLDLPPKPEKTRVGSHSEKRIYEGCLTLLQDMVEAFKDWCDYEHLQDHVEEDEEFSFSMDKTDVVRMLFLFGTSHSGMTSTLEKCRELGIDTSERLVFRAHLDREDSE